MNELLFSEWITTEDTILARSKHSQAKFGIEKLVNIVLQWYKVELLIVHTIIQRSTTPWPG